MSSNRDARDRSRSPPRHFTTHQLEVAMRAATALYNCYLEEAVRARRAASLVPVPPAPPRAARLPPAAAGTTLASRPPAAGAATTEARLAQALLQNTPRATPLASQLPPTVQQGLLASGWVMRNSRLAGFPYWWHIATGVTKTEQQVVEMLRR
eukprot:gnl/TRDRNA2_/TRDRNA2_154859_c0_seq1.p1 gnl/TRDRNA2_/TRDRNA2_154859_c0~~gnl/TRDRNA2_/TRDRNA2_154859_c0_seq1.p1  ORF type:complete len:153 (+),score=29.15 gnl/TRDRNA2_/TRDRNA2_154859_c0_seq1:32-490(+)